MKKTAIILLLSFLLLNCGQNNDNKKEVETEKPEQNFMSFRDVSKKLIEIDIDTISDFKELIEVTEKIDCTGKIAVFKIETDKKIYKIQPLQVCDYILDYKLREIIYVNTDSVIVNYKIKFPIDSLKVVLDNHLRNQNNNPNYPSSDEKKLISINVDSTKNISETRNLLLKIIADFNDLNIKSNFAFMFEDRGILPELTSE